MVVWPFAASGASVHWFGRSALASFVGNPTATSLRPCGGDTLSSLYLLNLKRGVFYFKKGGSIAKRGFPKIGGFSVLPKAVGAWLWADAV